MNATTKTPLFEVEVVSVHTETPTINSYTVQRRDGTLLPDWEPGAHIDVEVLSGERRQYSLCGDPQNRRQWTFAVLREQDGRGGSVWIHDAVHDGSVLRVSPPRNNFPLGTENDLLFLAGGIGITPIIPMIDAAEARGAQWRLVYGARTADAFAFRHRLSRYGDRISWVNQEVDGIIDVPNTMTAQPDSVVYCCGPSPLISSAQEHGESAGIKVRVERFTPVEAAHSSQDEPFDVVLQRSGMTVHVTADESIREAVERAGVEVDWSCSEGICGTCETKVLEGVPDQRDSVLSKAEQESGQYMMICCSRAKTPKLVLDL